ncbi:hypothetical protein [Treponema sp.]|uniref:hypothetical protein n=1 Tax=Treponema sp. TaxID=166 RepID=UPI00298DFD84|nr:hypothetical protein [Treponema sp.]MCQ2241019.1 hypothetical protein [Treponema sp.]
MKKILAAVVLASVVLSGVSAKKSIKDTIDQVKIGRFKEVEIGSSAFRLDKTLGSGLVATDYSVKLYSDDGSVGIYYKTDLASKESLRFDKDARDALRSAYEQYLVDYEGKKLKKSKKFVDAYGVARTKIVWKMLSDSATAHPKAYFGYCFVGKSPYFCIRIKQTEAEQKKGDIVVRHLGFMMYFTRAQLKDLLDCMDESEIQKTYSAATAVLELPEDDYEEAGGEFEEDYVEEADEKTDSKKARKYKKVEEIQPEEDVDADYSEAK